MNPKDMTDEELVELVSRKQWSSIGCYYTYEGQRGLCLAEDELLRRLYEADALRKENEELRKDKDRIDFLDDGNYGIDPRNIPGVTMNGRRFHCLAGRGDWSSLRDAIDAARAKESEASHE